MFELGPPLPQLAADGAARMLGGVDIHVEPGGVRRDWINAVGADTQPSTIVVPGLSSEPKSTTTGPFTPAGPL